MAETFYCPCCRQNREAGHFVCNAGAKGGKATGKSKTRSKAHYARIAKARWAKVKAEKKLTAESANLP